jgi:hypothetical protein
VSPIAGFVRHRKHQLGQQTVFGTPVAATRIVPWRGTPDIDPNWTDPSDDVDMGTIDPVLPPFRTATDITQTLEGPGDYRSLIAAYLGGIKGGVTGTGGGPAKTWTFQAATEPADALDYFTDEWGDEVTGDQVDLEDGVVEEIRLTMPDNLGPWTVSTRWRFGTFTYPATRTSLSADASPIWMYGADTELFINDTSGAIGTTKISDAFHSAEIVITNEIDLKRFANGSNTRFELAGYGRAGRTVTASFRLAKTTESLAEVTKWLSADPVNRFVELLTTSPTVITGSTKYSHSLRLMGSWFTRAHGEMGGNTVHTLELRGRHDAGLGYPLRAVVVNDIAAW